MTRPTARNRTATNYLLIPSKAQLKKVTPGPDETGMGGTQRPSADRAYALRQQADKLRNRIGDAKVIAGWIALAAFIAFLQMGQTDARPAQESRIVEGQECFETLNRPDGVCVSTGPELRPATPAQPEAATHQAWTVATFVLSAAFIATGYAAFAMHTMANDRYATARALSRVAETETERSAV